MSVVLLYGETGEGIYNSNTGKTWGWTGHDYVPYFNFSDLGAFGAGDLTVLNPTSTYDLSKFKIGHEVSMSLMIVGNTGGSSETVQCGIKIYRKLISESEEFVFNYSFNPTINPGDVYAVYAGTGVDYDEEWLNIEHMRYSFVINNSEVGSKTVTYTNSIYLDTVPSFSKGKIWIEGDNIAFTDGASDGNRYAKHLIRHDGTSYSTGRTPGYIRIDQVNNGKICYIDSSGVERKTYLARNYWLNYQLATGQTPGYMWVSGGSETYSYLNFIGYDGKHYCIINGTAVGYEGNLLP